MEFDQLISDKRMRRRRASIRGVTENISKRGVTVTDNAIHRFYKQHTLSNGSIKDLKYTELL